MPVPIAPTIPPTPWMPKASSGASESVFAPGRCGVRRVSDPVVVRIEQTLFCGDGNRRGVLVLNYLGQVLLQRLGEVSSRYGGNLALLDHEGYWMLSATAEDAWGYLLGRPEATLASRHPASWRRLQAQQSGTFVDHAGYWAYNHFDPGQAMAVTHGNHDHAEHWLLVSRLPHEQVQVLRFEVFWQVLLFVAAMLVGMLVFAALERRRG